MKRILPQGSIIGFDVFARRENGIDALVKRRWVQVSNTLWLYVIDIVEVGNLLWRLTVGVIHGLAIGRRFIDSSGLPYRAQFLAPFFSDHYTKSERIDDGDDRHGDDQVAQKGLDAHYQDRRNVGDTDKDRAAHDTTNVHVVGSFVDFLRSFADF